MPHCISYRSLRNVQTHTFRLDPNGVVTGLLVRAGGEPRQHAPGWAIFDVVPKGHPLETNHEFMDRLKFATFLSNNRLPADDRFWDVGDFLPDMDLGPYPVSSKNNEAALHRLKEQERLWWKINDAILKQQERDEAMIRVALAARTDATLVASEKPQETAQERDSIGTGQIRLRPEITLQGPSLATRIWRKLAGLLRLHGADRI